MGYITFFPKNNNENFQSIPEPEQPDPSQLEQLQEQQTMNNSWISEKPKQRTPDHSESREQQQSA